MTEEKKPRQAEARNEMLVRIMGQDLLGSRMIYPGLTRIKGVSWAISNAVCKKLKLDRAKKVSEINKEEIKRIEEFIKHPDIPDYLKNRRADFDIKRLKQIKSYKGVRHTFGLPTRGQRTRSHFRKTGIAVGVRKPKTGKKS